MFVTGAFSLGMLLSVIFLGRAISAMFGWGVDGSAGPDSYIAYSIATQQVADGWTPTSGSIRNIANGREASLSDYLLTLVLYIRPTLTESDIATAFSSFGALAIALVYKTYKAITLDNKAETIAFWTVIIFYLPPLILFTNTVGKDGLFLLGISSLTLGIVHIYKFFETYFYKAVLAIIFGLYIVHSVRPYFLFVSSAVMFAVSIPIYSHQLLTSKRLTSKLNWTAFILILFCVAYYSKIGLSQDLNTDLSRNLIMEDVKINWTNTPYIPEVVDTYLRRVTEIRAKLIYFAGEYGVTTDYVKSYSPRNAYEFLAYIPQVVHQELFFGRCIYPLNSNVRHNLAVLTFNSLYLLANIGILGWLLSKRLTSVGKPTVILFYITALAITHIFAYTSPNFGTQIRVMLPFYIIITLGGMFVIVRLTGTFKGKIARPSVR